MIAFGPVAEAAKGGHGSPAFDLFVGFAGLALTWIGYGNRVADHKISLWVACKMSAICMVFIGLGLYTLFL